MSAASGGWDPGLYHSIHNYVFDYDRGLVDVLQSRLGAGYSCDPSATSPPRKLPSAKRPPSVPGDYAVSASAAWHLMEGLAFGKCGARVVMANGKRYGNLAQP